MTGGGIELDHLQYAGFNTAGPTPTQLAAATATPTRPATSHGNHHAHIDSRDGTPTPTPVRPAAVANSTGPADGTRITTRTDIVGTASSATLAS